MTLFHFVLIGANKPLYSVEAMYVDDAIAEFEIYASESGLDRDHPNYWDDIEIFDNTDDFTPRRTLLDSMPFDPTEVDDVPF
jgi:hypothetical protein